MFRKRKLREIFPLISHILFHIWNILNIACHKNSLKFTFSLLTNSNLIESTGICLEKLLIWNSYKWTTEGTQNSNRNVFEWKILPPFQVSLNEKYSFCLRFPWCNWADRKCHCNTQIHNNILEWYIIFGFAFKPIENH